MAEELAKVLSEEEFVCGSGWLTGLSCVAYPAGI
jgi:hypothetical protein